MKDLRLPLVTPRLVIRDFEDGDFEAVHAYGSDPEVVRFVEFGPNTEEETRDFLNRAKMARWERPRKIFHLAVVGQSDGRLIGGCGIYVDAASQQATIGYTLSRDAWRQGIGTEVAQALLRFGFERLKLHRIAASCDVENVASWRVMEKEGMRREGHLIQDRWQRGHWRDSYLYAILQEEWRAGFEREANRRRD